MASIYLATTITSRKNGPPSRGWEELRRQSNAKILKAMLNDSDSDPDYEPSSDETELTQPDTETESSCSSCNWTAAVLFLITRGRKRLRRPDERVKTRWTRMWANAQHDGRPAEHRWRPVLNAAKFGSHTLLKCRAVTPPKYESERVGGCKVNFAPGKIP